MLRRASLPFALLLAALLAAACGSGGTTCSIDNDCPEGQRCNSFGQCIPRTDGDSGPDGDGTTDGDVLPDGDGTVDGDSGPDGDTAPQPGPRISLSRTLVEFGAVELGQNQEKDLIISNLGDEPLTVREIVFLEGSLPSDEFSYGPSNAGAPPFTIETGFDRELFVMFEPLAEELREGRCLIRSNDPVHPEVEVRLLSVPKGVAGLTLSPDPVEFGAVPVSQGSSFSELRDLTVKSVGGAPVYVTEIRLADDGGGVFSVYGTTDRPPFQLEPGFTSTVTVRYAPRFGGPSEYTGTLSLTYQDENGNPVEKTASLHGATSQPEPPCIKVEPMEGGTFFTGVPIVGPGLRFGTVQLYDIERREIAITNCGDEDLWIYNILQFHSPMFCMDPGNPFGGTCDFFSDLVGRSFVVRRGESAIGEVRFAPQGMGQQAGNLQIQSNARVAPDIPPDQRVVGQMIDQTTGQFQYSYVNFGLTGNGGTRDIDVLPSKVDHGLVTVGCCSPWETITVWDVGDMTLDITAIRISAGSDPGFQLGNLPRLPYTLNGGQTVQVDVRWCAPLDAAEGAEFHGSLEIVSNDATQDVFTVPLQGTATTSSHQRDVFRQPEFPMVDILWVVDNSGSMGDEQEKLADQFDVFINIASSWNADFQIAMISNQLAASDNPTLGKFVGNPPILLSSTPAATLKQQWRATINALGGPAGGDQEGGLEAGHVALSPPLSTDAARPNSRFVREQAVLAIINVSDEEDQSAPDTGYYIDFYRNIKGFRNTEMLQMYAIVGDSGNGCTDSSGQGGAGPGDRYIEVAEACGGFFLSICSQSYEPVYTDLGNSIFGLRREFYLSRMADPATIVVKVNGAAQRDGWTYEADANSILFDEQHVPPAGAEIVVEYDALCLR